MNINPLLNWGRVFAVLLGSDLVQLAALDEGVDDVLDGGLVLAIQLLYGLKLG
jgi:hypothetical protein